VATAIGPFLGGYLIQAVSWRLVFFINLPLAALVIAISIRHVPETKAPGPVPKLDIRGALTISGALAGITYGLIAASTYGWGSVPVLVPLGVGLILLGLFIWVEASEPQPMLPLGVFRSREFTAANAVTFIVYGALGGLLFLVPVVLQVAHGYSPVEAGAALLPVTFIMLALSSYSGALSARIGPRLQMTVGPLVIAASLLLFTRLGSSGNYLTAVLPAVLVFGLGVAINVAPLTATAMSSAPAEHAGVASAVNNDVARAASLIAVAVLPALAGITGNSYLHPAALAHGFKTAAIMAAVFCAAGGVLAGLTIRNPSRAKTTGPSPSYCALEATPLQVPLTPAPRTITWTRPSASPTSDG
jgi:MFS family permease